MTDPQIIATQGIDAILARLPEAHVSCEVREAPVLHWTWSIVIDSPTVDDPNYQYGASRQFATSDEMPEPTQEVLDLIATEVFSSLNTPPMTQEQNA